MMMILSCLVGTKLFDACSSALLVGSGNVGGNGVSGISTFCFFFLLVSKFASLCCFSATYVMSVRMVGVDTKVLF